MRRREILAAAAAILAFASPASAQKAHRIGVLTPSTAQWDPKVFEDALQDLGRRRRDFTIEVRSAEGNLERLDGLARELVTENVDVILALNTPGTQAAVRATKAVPIVMGFVGDPLGMEFVASINRPGRNVTGVAIDVPENVTKRMQLLTEVAPAAKRIALLYHPGDPIARPQIARMETVALTFGVEWRLFEVGALAALVRAFEQAKEWRADAVLRLAGQGLTGGRETAALALSHRLPSMLLSRADVEAGGLMSYYIDFNPGWRRLATYVDRILKGAPPGELPVEYAADYRLVLNRRTADALGLTIPPTLLARADEVIE